MRNVTRWQRVVLAAVAAVATLLVVFAATGPAAGPGGEVAAGSGALAASGWRWESYDGVVVAVPDDWGYGRSDGPPCLSTQDQTGRGHVGYVGRPGPVPAIACTGTSTPAQGKQSPYLWFDSQADTGVLARGGGWAAETRVVAGLALTVFSDDAALRKRILDSARPASGGAGDGCPAEHAITTGPKARPDPGPGGLAAMGPVESMSLCRYTLATEQDPDPMLLSSSQLAGEQARAVVRAILSSPAGDGPDEPASCAPEAAHGDEVLLLIVRDGTRTQDAFVRYSGCTGHGVDDGHTRRGLTTAALTPLLSGPHRPDVLNGAVADLLR